LRRTFASILAELNAPMRRCMQLLGHTDPKMTVGVDEQVMDMEDDGLQIIENLLGGDAHELFARLSGRAAKGPFEPVTGQEAEKMPSWPSEEAGQEG
jgi:hypothetical protein